MNLPESKPPFWLGYLPGRLRARIAQRPGLLKILGNIGWLSLDKVLRMGVGLFVGVWVARYLGPEQFGQLSYAMAFVALFGAIATMGLRPIIVRDLVRDPAHSGTTLGTAFALQILGGFAAISVVLVTAAWIRPGDDSIRVMINILALGQLAQVSGVVSAWFESQVMSRYVVWVESAALMTMATVKIGLILLDTPLVAFAWTALIEAVICALGLFAIYIHKTHALKNWKLSLTRALGMLRDSWPLVLSGLVLMIQARIDQVMLGEMVGDQEVGYYSAALRLVEAAAFGAIMISQSLLPAIVRAKEESEARYQSLLLDYYRLHFLVSLFIGVPLALFGNILIVLLLGADYAPAGVLLTLMSARLFFTHMGVARTAFMLNENLLGFSLLTMFIGTVSNILLNLVLIPFYQGEGAVLATLVSFFITTFALDLIYLKTRGNSLLMLQAMVTGSLFRKVL